MNRVMDPITHPLYTVQRAKMKTDELFGPVHCSMTGNETMCGIVMDEKWWILTNASDGTPTCKKCLKTHASL